jgi:hypothetical protein
MDLETLRRIVENDIASYRYEFPAGCVGNPWTAERIEAQLAVMRSALVDPYWVDVEVRDTFEQIIANELLSRKCAVVADDTRGSIVVFDPIERGFALVEKHDDRLISIGVRGDAVGCFMSR